MEEIKQAVNTRNAGWKAGETSVTRLPESQRSRLCGALPEPDSVIKAKRRSSDAKFAKADEVRAHPTAFSWLDVNGDNWISGVRNQSPWGTCASFGFVACLETYVKQQADDPDLEVDLSERFLFSYGGGDALRGWWGSQSGDFLTAVGVVNEEDCPYDEWDGAPDTAPIETFISGDLYAVEDWEIIFEFYLTQYEDELKTHLLETPLPVLMYVYEDFNAYTGGIYTHVTGEYVGNHYVQLIGWSDEEDYWLCKNSWGEDWGEAGYFRMKKSNKANSNFPDQVYRLYPRNARTNLYKPAREYSIVLPDNAALSSVNHVKGLLNPEDVTLQMNIIHQNIPDLAIDLVSNQFRTVRVFSSPEASYPEMNGVYFNDKCGWNIETFFLYRGEDGADMGNYRGCMRPEQSIQEILPLTAYGKWRLDISDNAEEGTGTLNNWGLFFAADQPPASADPVLWNRY